MNLVHTVYEPAGEGPFPTIFAMHGWGLSAFDLHGIAPFIADGKLLVLCPQGRHPVQYGLVNGYGWYETKIGSKPDEEKIDRAVDDLKGFINEAFGRYPIDRERIALMGFSQGGMMAYNLALRWPDRFAALVGISTMLPDYLYDRAKTRGTTANLPTLVEHGRADTDVDMARARKSVERLRELVTPVTFRDYSCGHEVCAEGIQDISTFLQEHVLNRAKPA